MLANQLYTIPANPTRPEAQDYDFLRAAGLNHIQQLSGNIWTDDNIHDPGITILELLCYALCDLGYRTSFDIADILTEPGHTSPPQRETFYTASEILTCNPVTITDYRKTLIDYMPVLINAWLKTNDNIDYSPTIYYDTVLKINTLSPPSPDHPSETLQLKGLYSVTLELEDYSVAVAYHNGFLQTLVDYLPTYSPPVYSPPFPLTDGNIISEEMYALGCINYACALMKSMRNLCEDVDRIKVLMEERVGICADIVLTANADQQSVWEQIYNAVNNFISPRIPTYTFGEMLANGKRIDQIFQGTIAQRGFIDLDELATFDQVTVIYTAEIIRVIMAIEGVQAVRNLSLSSYHETQPGVWTVYESTQKYCLHLSDPLNYNFSLALDFNETVPSNWFNQITFIKGQIYFTPQHGSLNFNDVIIIPGIPDGFTPDLPYPTGTYRDTKDYISIQNEFPKNYMLGPDRVPASTTPLRQAQRLQLKGYLVFFEQLLADYLAQLTNINRILSWRHDPNVDSDGDFPIHRNIDRTYYYQKLTEIPGIYAGINEISDIGSLINSYWATLGSPPVDYADLIENDDLFYDRKSRFLDHLLARFNENFVDYSLFQFAQNFDSSSTFYSTYATKDIVEHKMKFLDKYPALSGGRSRAVNYAMGPLASGNISGLEYRALKIVGIDEPDETGVPEFQYLVQVVEDVDGNPIFFDGKYHIIDNRLEPFTNVFGMHVLEYILLRPQFPTAFTAALYNRQTQSSFNPLNGLDIDLLYQLTGSPPAGSPPAGEASSYFNDYPGFPGAPGPESQGFIDNLFNAILTNAVNYANVNYATVPAMYLRNLIAHAFYCLYLSAQSDAETAAGLISPASPPSIRNWRCLNDLANIANNRYTQMSGCLYPDQILFFNDPDQIKEDCLCMDPYSMKITAVLPGWLPIAEDAYFRNFMEQTIRMEAPAHVGVRICWLDPAQMYQFEQAYVLFMNALMECNSCIAEFQPQDWIGSLANYFASLAYLQIVLGGLKNTYPPATLDGCNTASYSPPASPPYPGYALNSIILNQTAITGSDLTYEFVPLWNVVLFPAMEVVVNPVSFSSPPSSSYVNYSIQGSPGFYSSNGLTGSYPSSPNNVYYNDIALLGLSSPPVAESGDNISNQSVSYQIPLLGQKTVIWSELSSISTPSSICTITFEDVASYQAFAAPVLVFDSVYGSLLAYLLPSIAIELVTYDDTSVTLMLTCSHAPTTASDIGLTTIDMEWLFDALGGSPPDNSAGTNTTIIRFDTTSPPSGCYTIGVQANYTSLSGVANIPSSAFSMVIQVNSLIESPPAPCSPPPPCPSSSSILVSDFTPVLYPVMFAQPPATGATFILNLFGNNVNANTWGSFISFYGIPHASYPSFPNPVFFSYYDQYNTTVPYLQFNGPESLNFMDLENINYGTMPSTGGLGIIIWQQNIFPSDFLTTPAAAYNAFGITFEDSDGYHAFTSPLIILDNSASAGSNMTCYYLLADLVIQLVGPTSSGTELTLLITRYHQPVNVVINAVPKIITPQMHWIGDILNPAFNATPASPGDWDTIYITLPAGIYTFGVATTYTDAAMSDPLPMSAFTMVVGIGDFPDVPPSPSPLTATTALYPVMQIQSSPSTGGTGTVDLSYAIVSDPGFICANGFPGSSPDMFFPTSNTMYWANYLNFSGTANVVASETGIQANAGNYTPMINPDLHYSLPIGKTGSTYTEILIFNLLPDEGLTGTPTITFIDALGNKAYVAPLLLFDTTNLAGVKYNYLLADLIVTVNPGATNSSISLNFARSHNAIGSFWSKPPWQLAFNSTSVSPNGMNWIGDKAILSQIPTGNPDVFNASFSSPGIYTIGVETSYICLASPPHGVADLPNSGFTMVIQIS